MAQPCVAVSDITGDGHAEPVDPERLGEEHEKTVRWIHLDGEYGASADWLEENTKLDPLVIESLTVEDARPRSYVKEKGLLLVLRGVNLNPGADLDDMVSVRAWIETGRIITLYNRRVMAVEDIREAFKDGSGPCDSGEFLVELAFRLSERMFVPISDIEDAADELEERVIDEESRDLRLEISDLRHKAIRLKRFLGPQREAFASLQSARLSWITEKNRLHLREVANRMTYYVEELDSARDRAVVAGDELKSRLAEQTGKTIYVMSMITVVFLPLGLITGLLGINVGGIPGAQSPYGFFGVCLILLVIVVCQLALLRKMRWF
ncbi:MAG: zinc transporter ZntB [Thermodesulfobacteriota bacterium]